MTAFRNSIRKIAHRVRAIPGEMGWRPYTVQVEYAVYSGAKWGEGSKLVTTTSVTEYGGQPPKVRWLSDQEIAIASGNGSQNATVQVGPITPNFPGGGTSIDVLRPPLSANTRLYYIITGPEHPNGGRYRPVKYTTDRAGHYLVDLERAAD